MLGVGIIGAGVVTQAIHVPTLATLADRLRVVHVMDVDATLAERVASAAGARHSSTVEELLADPEVAVVAIGSPDRFHAEQVEAACAAGKRAILCEKPLATDRHGLRRIADATRAAGVPVLVGAMLVYDPAFRAALAEWNDTARLVRSMIALPPNDRFVAMATELQPGSAPPRSSGTAADKLRGLTLGLATHAIPLVRCFAPDIDELVSARVIEPVGYDLTLRSGDAVVQLLAHFNDHWRPDWHLEAWGAEQQLRADFPPSFVLAGSGIATLGERAWRFGENGYQAEWRHLADVVEGAEPLVSVEHAVADIEYAL